MLAITTVIEPILQIGSQGLKVKELQELLNREFSLPEQKIAVDGIFGPETEYAVKAIQYHFFLKQDGIVGLDTWYVLRTHSLLEKPLLQRGSRGELVTRVQQVLQHGGYYTGVIHGNFDWQMEDAVKALQRENGLWGDGIIGTTTWQVLLNTATFLSVD